MADKPDDFRTDIAGKAVHLAADIAAVDFGAQSQSFGCFDLKKGIFWLVKNPLEGCFVEGAAVFLEIPLNLANF